MHEINLVEAVMVNKLVIILLVLIWNSSVNAYEDKITHPELTKKAIASSNLESYLISNLGNIFSNGIEKTFINGKSVRNWLTGGSTAEDAIICRRSTHFLNPLRQWLYAGMNEFLVNDFCTSYQQPGANSKYSALTWVTGYETYGGPTVSRNNQSMGWDNARSYFYSALTSNTNADRDAYFAQTFQAVGQVLHLLQDMAVPGHVRNDFVTSHLLQKGTNNPYELYVRNHNELITGLQNVIKPQFTSPRITDFWDISDGSLVPNVPDAILNPALQIKSGLAEYTNANFVSEGTLFTNSNTFLYPALGSTEVQDIVIQDPLNPGATKTRAYYYKTQDWEKNYLLAGVDLITFSNLESSPSFTHIAPLDDKVHEHYAKLLLPRAVGYSAALLDYFFRGALDVSWPETGVYSIADGSQTPFDADGNHHQQFTKIKAAILNITPNEAIGAGTLTAVARYKIIPNYAPDLSNYPPDGLTMTGNGTPQHPGVPYSYSVSDARTLTNQDEIAAINDVERYAEMTFDFTAHPIPAGITDLTLQVVFKGTIGNEADNAIAVGMKDITEPTHLTFWNLSDMFSLKYPGTDYVPYTFETLQTMAQQSASLLDWLDDTNDGSLNDEVYLKPYTSTFTISFWNNSAMVPATTVDIPAGGHIRMLVLVNQSANNYVELKWHDPVNTDSVIIPFTGVVDQADQSGAYTTPTPVDTFREKHAEDWQTLVPIKQHNYAGVVGCKPATGSTYCPYSDEDADPVTLTPTQFTTDFN